MMLLLILFTGLALGWSDKLDRTYLPPPGSKFSGGSAGDIQTPLEFSKVSPFPGSPGPFRPQGNQLLAGPSNGFYNNQQTLQGFKQPGLGQDSIQQSPYVPSQQAPLNNFQDNLNLPVTTTSYAYTQTTSYPADFESVTRKPGYSFESQRIDQLFPSAPNVPGQASYSQGNGILNQGSYNQQSPFNAQGRPSPQNVQVAGQQNYQAPTSQFVNPNFLTNDRVQNNQDFSSSPTPSFSQYGSQNIDQYQQSSNPNITSGSPTFIPNSQSGHSFHVQPSPFPSSILPQRPTSNQYRGSLNNIQPPGVPSFSTTQSPIISQYQNVGTFNNALPSAGFQTTQIPIPNNQYQSYGPNTPNQRVFKNNQNRFSPDGELIPQSLAASNGLSYSQLASQDVNGNVGDSQRINPNNPSSGFEQPSSTPIPTNFVSPTTSTFSPEFDTLSTPLYSNGQIQAQHSVSINGPDRIQADGDGNAIILNYENVLTPEGFSYSFDTSNGIHADESGTTTDGVKASGSYSYTGDDGKVYSVMYTADENGFLPRGDHIPTPPPIPEAILRVIEQAYRYKEAGIIFDDGSYTDDKYGPTKYQGTTSNVEQYGPRMEGVANKSNSVTPTRVSQDLRKKDQSSTGKDTEVDYNDDEIKTEEVESEDGTANQDESNENDENIYLMSTIKTTSGERKSNNNRKQEKPMKVSISSKMSSRPKLNTSDDSEDEQETSVTSYRTPSKNKSPIGSQRGKQSQNIYRKLNMKDQHRPSSKNSGIRQKVPVFSSTARHEEENSKFNGNPYLPNQSRKNDDKYETNGDDEEDSYDYLQSDADSSDLEDSQNSQESFSQLNTENYPEDQIKINPSAPKVVTLNQRSKTRPLKPISSRSRPYNDYNDEAIDNVNEYQAESITPSLMDKKKVNKTFKQQKQPVYSTRRPFVNNQGPEIGYEYNPPQKTYNQNPSIRAHQNSGAQTQSGPKDLATRDNEYDHNTLNNEQRFTNPYGPTSSLQNYNENQRVTSISTSTEYPDEYLDNSSGPNGSLDSLTPKTKIKPQMTYETGSTRRPAFKQKLQTTSLAPKYNQRFPVNGQNMYNNQLSSQTPTHGQTEINRFISSTTPLPRRPSTFGPPSTSQRATLYNQDNRNQYSTTSKPFAGNNQYYQPGIDSNLTRISVLGPKYLPAATDPSSNDNGFGRPGQLQPTFGRVPSTTYRPNYSIIDNVTTGSTPEVRFGESTTLKYNRVSVDPAPYEQLRNTFTSVSQKETSRPGYSNDLNFVSSTAKPFYQQGFQQSYQPNTPVVTPAETPGPSYGPYPTNGNASPTTERQYQVFQQQQPTMGPIDQGISKLGPYTPGQRHTPTSGLQTNHQQGDQLPAGKGLGLSQGPQTNTGPEMPGPFQGSNNGAGEDFSGPKRPQYFDPETGYHY